MVHISSDFQSSEVQRNVEVGSVAKEFIMHQPHHLAQNGHVKQREIIGSFG
jgi:hypothetical protein